MPLAPEPDPTDTGTIATMPTYEYRCRTCGDTFEVRRSMADADQPARCPDGHDDTTRLLSVFASVGGATGGRHEASAPATRPAGGCGGACACAH